MTRPGSLLRAVGCALAASMSLGCAIGKGEGQAESDDLFVDGCADGPYSLDPNYFTAENIGDSQLIRVQNGNNTLDNSDGVFLIVSRVEELVESGLGRAQPVFLSPELVPEGVPVAPAGSGPRVSLSLHLGETCEKEVVALQAISGTVTLDALYTGLSETAPKKDRLTAGSFDVIIADPRTLVPDDTTPEGYSSSEASHLTGSFSFTYRKGQPAQAFP